MTIKNIANYLEEIAPLKQAEDFDNVGLLIGDYNTLVTGVLVTLDTLEETIDEAVAKNCNLFRAARSPDPIALTNTGTRDQARRAPLPV